MHRCLVIVRNTHCHRSCIADTSQHMTLHLETKHMACSSTQLLLDQHSSHLFSCLQLWLKKAFTNIVALNGWWPATLVVAAWSYFNASTDQQWFPATLRLSWLSPTLCGDLQTPGLRVIHEVFEKAFVLQVCAYILCTLLAQVVKEYTAKLIDMSAQISTKALHDELMLKN